MRASVGAVLATTLAFPAAAQQTGSGAPGQTNADQTRMAPPVTSSGTATRPASPAPVMIGHPAQPSGPGFAELTSQDQQFVQEAAVGVIAEIEAGKLAQEHASSEAVKDFGRRMVEEHGKAAATLAEWAQARNVTLPTALNADRQRLRDQLAGLRGVAFDQAYVNGRLDDHRKSADVMRQQVSGGSDEQLKAFASETLPMVQDHQKMLEGLANQIVVGKK